MSIADVPQVELAPALLHLEARVLADPAVDRIAWHEKRLTGVTATDVKSIKNGSERAFLSLKKKKLAGVPKELRSNAVRRGHSREDVILGWAERRFGISAFGKLVHHPDFPQHLASPDGAGVLEDGTLALAEVKTSKYDDDPTIRGGHFDEMHYQDQLDWELYVGDAQRILFIWEQHDDAWPMPTPLHMEPRFMWFERDAAWEERIANLILRANQHLANMDDEAVMSDDPDDYRELVRDFLTAKGKVDTWQATLDTIKAEIDARIGDRESFAIDTDEGSITRSTSNPKPKFDPDAWARRAPAQHRAWSAAQEKYTKPGNRVRSLRVTPLKTEGEAHERNNDSPGTAAENQ